MIAEAIPTISIHAPAGGVTSAAVAAESTEANFNSRPCGRGDCTKLLVLRVKCYFNSRPCGRGDSPALSTLVNRNLFQFTPLREGRRLTHIGTQICSYFNSRPCGRGDPLDDADMMWFFISIHAPAGGATAMP